jgi:hypothetical protein
MVFSGQAAGETTHRLIRVTPKRTKRLLFNCKFENFFTIYTVKDFFREAHIMTSNILIQRNQMVAFSDVLPESFSILDFMFSSTQNQM